MEQNKHSNHPFDLEKRTLVFARSIEVSIDQAEKLTALQQESTELLKIFSSIIDKSL